MGCLAAGSFYRKYSPSRTALLYPSRNERKDGRGEGREVTVARDPCCRTSLKHGSNPSLIIIITHVRGGGARVGDYFCSFNFFFAFVFFCYINWHGGICIRIRLPIGRYGDMVVAMLAIKLR